MPTKAEDGAQVIGLCAGNSTKLGGVVYNGPVLITQWNWKPSSSGKATTMMNTVAVTFESTVAGSALSKVKASIDLNNPDYFKDADTSK